MLLPAWRDVSRVIIGMVHLPPLAGAPRFGGDVEDVRRAVLEDARSLLAGGVDGLILENFGDAPFYPGRVPASVVAQMTVLAAEVKRMIDVPLGINVLRNDGLSGLAIAHAVGAEFVRINVLCGARITDQGLIEGIAHEVLRLRAQLDAAHIRILADVNVKHSAPITPIKIEDEVCDIITRGGADAIVISGAATGAKVDLDELQRARDAAENCPLFLGSGVTQREVAKMLAYADGAIIGTAFKRDGQVSNPVDRHRVSELVEQVRRS